MKKTILTLELRYEQDLVLVRQRVRQISELLKFDRQQQTRITTAVSEIGRNAFEYAGGGKVEISIGNEPEESLLIQVQDSGPGIAELQSVMDGSYVSRSGLGLGIVGARRLMEIFAVESTPGVGTRITLGKPIPKSISGRGREVVTPQLLRQIVDELAASSPQNPFQEVQQQNQELLSALEELRVRQVELDQVNRELEDTNRGVLALYAELDEKAASLRRASEAKTSFLSNMTHEFRTPLNSILGISRILLSQDDGPLAPEQVKQVGFIQKSATSLSELVNDLLDIAKVEAGKVELKVSEFAVSDLFGALRGILRPLLAPDSPVKLVVEEVDGTLLLRTDEGKVSQILRNLVSNALKFTESGEVRVCANRVGSHSVRFSVSDTGIGISQADQARIFEEFEQIESPLQLGLKGTGLGLPLSRRLAGLLGGHLSLESSPGQGSTFTLVIPTGTGMRPGLVNMSSTVSRVLIIDDEASSRYLLKDLFPEAEYRIVETGDPVEGLRLAQDLSPQLIFLDLVMPAMSGFEVLARLKGDPVTQNIPVVIFTSQSISDSQRELYGSQVLAFLSKDFSMRAAAEAEVTKAFQMSGLSARPDDLAEVSGA